MSGKNLVNAPMLIVDPKTKPPKNPTFLAALEIE
jgi:hypothetical protein